MPFCQRAGPSGKAVARKPVPRRSRIPGCSSQRTAMYIVGQEEIDAIAQVIRSGALFRYGIGGECDALRAALRRVSRHQARRADLQRHLRADRRGDRARHRPGRRGAGAGAHLHGDRDGGARGRRDPGDRRRRREHHHRPGRGRRRGRPAHQGGDPGAHVGCGLRHGPDHGDRRQARPAGARGHLPGRSAAATRAASSARSATPARSPSTTTRT